MSVTVSCWALELNSERKTATIELPQRSSLRINLVSLHSTATPPAPNSSGACCVRVKTQGIDGEDLDAMVGTLRPGLCDQISLDGMN